MTIARGMRESMPPGGESIWCTIDAPPGAKNLLPWLEENLDAVQRGIRTSGVVLFQGFSALTPQALHDVVSRISGAPLTYDERSSPRVELRRAVYTSTEYPSSEEIFLHNENAYARQWPQHIYFYCASSDCTGGETPVAENAVVARRIDSEVKREMQARGLLHRRTFMPGIALPAEEVFAHHSDTPLEDELIRNGYRVGSEQQGSLVIEYPHEPYAPHPETGALCWFNHAAFFQPQGINAATRAALADLYGTNALPNRMLYGDGQDIDADVVDHLRAAYSSAAVVRRWQKGDLLLLDNMRFAHGRRPFQGERAIWVAMAKPCNRQRAA